MRRTSLLGSLLVSLLLVVSGMAPTLAQSPVASPAASPVAATANFGVAAMDPTVYPGADFYRFALGAWLDQAEIPADQPVWGVASELIELTDQQQLSQLNALVANNTLEPGSDQWKAVELFRQAMDQDARNAAGITPLQPQLDLIDGIASLEDLHALIASPDGLNVPDFFNAYIYPDPADSSVNTGWIVGPYLGLGDVSFYTEDSDSNEAVRDAYKSAAAQFFQLLGYSEADATAAAQAAYDFEAKLAADMLTDVEAQDFAAMYNPTTLDELQTLYPALDWQAYLTSRGATVDGSTIVIDSELRLMQNLAAILESTDIEVIKDYLTFQLMLGAAPYLDQTSRDIRFGVIQALYGVEEPLANDKDALADVNALMPDAVGHLYADEYFSPEAKADVERLVDNLIAAFRVRLENNSWMSPETKAAALEKLDGMRVKVGYPDQWKTYDSYTIGDSYWASVNDSLVADYQTQMAKLGQPVNKDEWWMGAQEVNAGYDPTANDIMFPAAILQAPYYDPDADDATNYGAIGATIGHEITHGFDLSGSQFDADGNFADWWTEEDLAAFDALNTEVADQYSAIEVLPGVFVDGQLTVTENVADMGGLQIAWDALQLALQENGDPGEIDGYTTAQRFFIAFAQSWGAIFRDEYLQTLVASDEHAPDFVRAVVPSMNMDAFYDAFPEIQPGDADYLAPEDRIVIW